MASSMLIADVSASGSTETEVDKALKAALISCANDPDFAVICDFLQKFSKDLGLDLPNFKLLLQWLTKTDEVSPQLRDMQIKLLRKTRKTVHEKCWESALSKFCFTYSAHDGWEIERFGYKNSSSKVKLRILRELLECQFERNTKFRSKILTLSADSLRSKPIGRDRQGHAYWVTQDNECNIRIYQEHLDEEIWQVVATNRDEFANLLKRLKRSEVVQPCEDIDIIDEDTTSSSHIDSNSVQKDFPPKENDNSQENEQKIPKLSIKLAFGRNSKETINAKDLGKGEEELAAEEDAKQHKKSSSGAVESGDEEFEEIEEECEEESDSDVENENEVNDENINLNSSETEQNGKPKDLNKKVEPFLISQKKIIKIDTGLTSFQVGKKRSLYENDSVSSSKNENQLELKKLKPSLLVSKRSKSAGKNEESKNMNECKESNEENDEVEEEIDEEDIDSVAAEEDENEEKLFEEYDDEDEEAEVGEEISDPIVKVIGEGSGSECKVENYLYCIEYDLDNLVSPTLDDIIIEDVHFVYGEGNGKACLGGNKKSEEETLNVEKVTLSLSKTSSEEVKSESQSDIALTKNENNNVEETDYKLCTSTKSASDKDKIKDTNTFIEDSDDKKIIDKNKEKSTENGNEILKIMHSQLEIKYDKGENISKETITEKQLNENKEPENLTLGDTKNPVVEKVLETSCKEDNKILSKEMKISSVNSTVFEGSMQQTHASKMSALESLKKELRESKQKTMEKKLPQPVENSKVNLSSTSIYNRKRRFTDQPQSTSARPTNSESEIELNSEFNEEISNEKEIDIDENEQDVGGKRLKMRPKQANFELRKKIEAQKVAANEETTSSSGEEEELRKQKNMVMTKQSTASETLKTEIKLQNLEYIKDDIDKNINDLVKEEVTSTCAVSTKRVGTTKSSKVKVTLAEIIEKKLKKTPERNLCDTTSTEKEINKDTAIQTHKLPSSNKSRITKPLKKNLLIQIRQEANDDEVPRKRCNSQDSNQTILIDIKAVDSITRDREEKAALEKQINTLERQRKRRSSEENAQNDTPEEPEAKIEVIAVKEKPASKRDKPNDAIKEKDTKEVLKGYLQKETIPVSERRSARRGGIISTYADTSILKKNRSFSKIPKEKIEANKEQNHKVKLKLDSNNPNCDDNKKEAEKIKGDLSTSNLNENDVKEDNTKNNTSLVEKTAKTDISSLKTSSTPKTPVKGARREVDTSNIIDVDSETPVRQSRRIAQQKIREEAERRKLEEIALRTMKQELKKKKKAEKQADPEVAPPTEPSSESEESDVEIKKKSQKKKFPGKNGNWSSGSEEQEEPEEEDEEPHHYETDHGSPLFKSDHEFSPESDIEDESQVVPMKRARTVRKEDADVDGTAINEAEESCQKCNKSDHPEWILLCDNCDKGYHCSCLSPVLFYIPEGDWYCPPCQQDQLIKALENKLKEFDDLVENKLKMEENEKRISEEQKAQQEKEEESKKCKSKKDTKPKRSDNSSSSDDHSQESNNDEESITNSNESKNSDSNNESKQKHRSRNFKKSDKRYKRDRRLNATRSRRNRLKNREIDSESDSRKRSSKSKSVSKSNSSYSSTYSESDNEPIYKLRKRRQINVSYRLNEYDDLINSALKKEMDEVAGAGNLGRGKDISTIIEADKEEKARQRQMEDSELEAIPKENNDQEKQQDSELNDANKNSNKEEIKKDGIDSDAEPIIRIKPSQKKKSRKLTTLDISSADDDGSDEDFKGSSIDDDDEDTSISASNSDSSLDIYKKHGKYKKKRRKASRRAFRERRRERRFVVDESDDEEVQRPKSKKKRKDDYDYTESEADEDEISDLSENIDSADLCDDTTTDESDGAWRPNKSKKAKKSTNTTVRTSPKLKISHKKKPKKVEYSDDDVSDSEEDEDEEVGGSGKGYGKQPRSQPLKKSSFYSEKTKGKGKEKPAVKSKNKKPSEDESSQSNSEDSTRRTRGRRYAYIEDFDDDSSDGGIKPGVQRPDTPPEEREKFIKRQEEIKRMLAEKNAEGAKLAATPRLTPIKTDSEKDKQTSPAKAGGDSLSTVPLSVIRQAKVLDIDYLQRRGENLDDLSNEVGVVDDDFDDADLPDDLPEDMDEDTIARMVEEEEEFVVDAPKELPAPDNVLRTSNPVKPIKTKEVEKPMLSENPTTSFSETSNKLTSVSQPTPSSVLQEPIRKRLPMPTIHPPLLRHQYLMHDSMLNTHHIMQRQGGPPTSHLLQNALSAPLSQPLERNYPSSTPPSSHHSIINRIAHSIPLQSTVVHALNTARTSHPPSSLITTKSSSQLDRPAQEKPTNPQNFTENKPRGRRKKITPLRDTLQKQQTAAAVTAATATNSSLLKNNESPLTSVIKSGSSQKLQIHHSAINNMQPSSHSPVGRPAVSMPPIRVPYVGADGPRFYDALGNRAPHSSIQRHRAPSQLPPSLLPPPPANRSSYGPPPPLKGSSSGPQPVSSSLTTSGPIRNPIQHIPPPYLGIPPNTRHASHLNMYRPPIYGNPNFGPRSSLRPPNIHAQEFTPASRAYPPYGFYPPPPPLTTPGQRTGPVLTSRASTEIPPTQSNIAHSSTSVIVSSKSSNSPSVTPKHAPAPIPVITDSSSKSVAVKKEFSTKSSRPKSTSPTHVIAQTEMNAVALSVTMPRKKLTTLQGYTAETSKKSPVSTVSDSSGSRSPPNPSTKVNDGSSAVGALEITPTDEQLASKEGKASEFSGLVSYFSSQHDDYNT